MKSNRDTLSYNPFAVPQSENFATLSVEVALPGKGLNPLHGMYLNPK